MRVRERNRQIKRVLAERFGWRNVRVKGDRGTAYGWVTITVFRKRPEDCSCEPGSRVPCEACRRVIDTTRDEVWQILKESGLYDEIGIYYDDMNIPHKECIVEVRIRDDVEEPAKREVREEIRDGYKIRHEGNWTWIYFDEKPPEDVREKLKAAGFRFSRRRVAWYKPEIVEAPL